MDGESAAKPIGCAADLVVLWQGWSAAPGQIALEAELAARLPDIRAEHAAWAWELGRLAIEGRQVQEWLQCGSEPSMWWCSLLYERHPKMTPALYDIYRL
ncbi:MAG: hypothetical protein IK116_06080, partial [Firmicutes bacterium]|nr:hypothetical protein [Bacillota bacterium]